MKKVYFLLLTVLFAAATTNAQVANYGFAASSGTYTPISGTIECYTGAWDDDAAAAIPIGLLSLSMG
ncbi:MAG: hypothetical protein IPI66_00990 [Chitinophagaceae bacterium]|nr:hypothetical protein [Chitinophagaceae bacterium]